MDIFGPNEVSDVFGVQFSPKQLEKLKKSRPTEDALAPYKDTHMLFVGHEGYPKPLTIVEIRRMAGDELFWNFGCSWYDRLFFASRAKVEFGWYRFRKVFVPESLGQKSWGQQERLILKLKPEPERRPTAVEAVYALHLYHRITGKRLLDDSFAWCSDVVVYGESSQEHHARVGYYKSRLAVGFCSDEPGYSRQGTFSCLKL